MPTQREQAYAEINRLKARFPELSEINERLRSLVSEAQNHPPQGLSDGSINEEVWTQLQGTQEALSTLLMTLLFHGNTDQPEVLSDDEIGKLLG